MKRCLPVAVLILLLYSPAAYASRTPAPPPSALTRLIGRVVSARGSVYLPARRDRPLAAPMAPSGQQASALSLPASVYSPATLNATYTGTITVTDADANFFRGFHSTGYESFGFAGGYYARADWQPSGSSDTVSFRYQGSILGSTTMAENAWTDGITYSQSQSGTSSQSCDNVLTVPGNCAIISYTTTANTTVTYLAAQINMCLIETSSDGPQAVVNANQSQVNQTLSSIAGAAIATAQTVCTNTPPTTVPTAPLPTATPTRIPTTPPTRPPTATPKPRPARMNFSIVAVRIEKNGAKPDYDLVRPPLKQALAGTQLQVATYFNVRSAPANPKLTITITIRSGGKTVINQTFHDKLGADPTGTYRDHVGPWNPKAGVYTISVQLASGHIRHSGQTTFTVLAKTPPAPPPVSFTFDALQTINGSAQLQSTFKPGERVGWKVTYTLKNLPAKTTATIIATYQNPTKAGWRPYGSPGIHVLTASNGANVYGDSFVLPVYPYNSLRIIVGITIGAQTQTRSVTIRVTH